MNIVEAIRDGFAKAPYPGSGYNDISRVMDDEGVYEHFVRSDQYSHDVKNLRIHSCAISYFTEVAFRYWFPAFMIADLEFPDEADIISMSIACHFADPDNALTRISCFSDSEIDATIMYLNFCATNADDPYRGMFEMAIENINKSKSAEQVAPRNR